MIEKLTGDVVSLVSMLKQKHPDSDIILVHGCNCFNNMGAGLAKTISKQWPLADKVDKSTLMGDKTKLGNYSYANVEPNVMVINLYTQYRYGHGLRLEYDALKYGLSTLVSTVNELFSNPIYLVPEYIGCGLAGGDINLVRPILSECLMGTNYYLFDKD